MESECLKLQAVHVRCYNGWSGVFLHILRSKRTTTLETTKVNAFSEKNEPKSQGALDHKK